MGKEWLHWVVGGGGGGSGGGSAARRGRMPEEMKDAATSAGCMCAVFQLFDLHHFQLPVNQQNTADFHPNNNPFLHEEATTSKGVEAPRNSLELEQPAAMDAASIISSAMKEEEILNFPAGIQITTSHGKAVPSSSPRVSISSASKKSRLLLSDDFSSECSSTNSPSGTKTPNLVARLMGLDLLPECSSPSSSSKPEIIQPRLNPKNRIKDRNSIHSRSSRSFFDDDFGLPGPRSLPETPRISSARRSDVEYHHHRLSLQINKENENEEFGVLEKLKAARRGRRFGLGPQDENRSPGHYARQIVKQVKDSVSRRVGIVDITNTQSTNRDHHTRRDENLILIKPTKKNHKTMSRFEGEISPDGKDYSSTPSCSPRLRFLDSNKNKSIANSNNKSPRISLSSSDNHPQSIIQLQEQQQQQKIDCKKVGKCSSSRLKKLPPQASDHAIRNKNEEPFVRSATTNKVNLTEKKPMRSSPLLSSDILNISSPTILQVKKDPSPPPTKLPQKQSQVSDAPPSKRSTQLSSNSSHSYKQLQLHPDNIIGVAENSTNRCATTLPGGAAAAEYGGYIQRILKRAGIINNVNPPKWHTPSHPIDPSIFHHLELFRPITAKSAAFSGGDTILNRRCNRKLIFQLVDELLAEILRPHFILQPRISHINEDDKFPLVDELCKKIDGFPASNCLVLEDIDSLIDTDLRKSRLDGFLAEEESVMCEIEGEIVEWLVRETVAEMGGGAAEKRTETNIRHVDASRGQMPFVGLVGPAWRGNYYWACTK